MLPRLAEEILPPGEIMRGIEWYGRAVGARASLRGRMSKQAAKLLLKPVAYWRAVEYAMALRQLQPCAGERILDVSSPKLLALYLANRIGCSVVATDLDGSFIPEWAPFQQLLGIPEDRLEMRVEDARSLSFEAASFDAVYSISVLEHIPDGGDSEAVAELARVLRPGGRLFLTVPFAPAARDIYVDPSNFYWSHLTVKNEDGLAFFQRRYDEQSLHNRLVAPSRLRPVAITYHGDRILVRSEKEVVNYLPNVTGLVQPLLASLLVEGPRSDWQQLRKPLCATLLLEKA